ncbi:MAG: hypothetical protein GC206_09595 [Alphaproteobacteria bacterium]|nr:hypothetical protein [Alphaproteobacteria bacterium]
MTPDETVPPPSLASLSDVVANAIEATYARLPALGAALVILLAGWALAFLVRALVRHPLRRTARVLDRVFRRGERTNVTASQRALTVLGDIAFWFTLLIAAALAAQVAGFTAVAGWLNAIVAHLPSLAAGAAIIVIGFIASILVGEQVAATARTAGARQGALLGRFAQAGVLITALIIGLGQIGVDVTLLIALAVVVTSAILIGFAIAFGLGARAFVADVIAARALRRTLRPGMRVRIGASEGEILEITATQIMIDTAEGKALTPARRAAGETVLVIDELVGSGDA